MGKEAKLSTDQHSPNFKSGALLRFDYKHALQINTDNNVHLWELFLVTLLSLVTEMDQINENETIHNMGRGMKPPCDYQQIRVHFIFDIKHDLLQKSQLIVGGHITEPSKDSIYSGVVSLRSLRLCMFLRELNGLKVDVVEQSLLV
jgi:hypothetical protein